MSSASRSGVISRWASLSLPPVLLLSRAARRVICRQTHRGRRCKGGCCRCNVLLAEAPIDCRRAPAGATRQILSKASSRNRCVITLSCHLTSARNSMTVTAIAITIAVASCRNMMPSAIAAMNTATLSHDMSRPFRESEAIMSRACVDRAV